VILFVRLYIHGLALRVTGEMEFFVLRSIGQNGLNIESVCTVQRADASDEIEDWLYNKYVVFAEDIDEFSILVYSVRFLF